MNTDPGLLHVHTVLNRMLSSMKSGRLRLHLPAARGLWIPLPKAHFHIAPELFLQPEGRTQFTFPTERFALQTGDACLLPAGLPHRDTPSPVRGCFEHLVVAMHSPSEVWLHVTRQGRADGSYQIVFRRSMQGPSAVRIARYFDDIFSAAAQPYQSTASYGLLTAILAVILDTLSSPDISTPVENIRVSQCKQHISTQLGNSELSVSMLAKQTGCTPDYLSSLFRRECGSSLIVHINQARMNRAAFLLKETTMSIKEVAVACGFTRSSYFIRVFHRLHGMSPLHYRKTIAGKHPNDSLTHFITRG